MIPLASPFTKDRLAPLGEVFEVSSLGRVLSPASMESQRSVSSCPKGLVNGGGYLDRTPTKVALAGVQLAARRTALRRLLPKEPTNPQQNDTYHIGFCYDISVKLTLANSSSSSRPANPFSESTIANGTKDSITKLVSDLNSAKLETDVDVVVSPPFVYLDQVTASLTGRIEVSAQNSWIGKGGAFTGEISVEQLKDIGCKWVILGHSERRHIIGEDDQFIGKKAAYALNEGLGVIACIGELLEEREAGKTFDVCFRQLKAFADVVPSWDNIVIAYEPVWAIGTGKVATPQQAQEVHVAVRDWLKKNVSEEVASKTRIIYG
ncbi:hypothetical protein Golob_002943, partial [Gossypium lobatum]|nr:hypothetical protein [Gossypium lobatum]